MPKRDLIERLTDEPTSRELKKGLDAETTRIWHSLCLEARDEIERLRAEVVSIWDQCIMFVASHGSIGGEYIASRMRGARVHGFDRYMDAALHTVPTPNAAKKEK